jgi:hypothetical protein
MLELRISQGYCMVLNLSQSSLTPAPRMIRIWFLGLGDKLEVDPEKDMAYIF